MRLTEREPYWLGEEFWVSAKEPDEEELDEVYMKLKHYEDLEEAGKLIELPCKVGDTVWGYWLNDGVIMLEELYITNEQQALLMKDLWGKKVFATPKEAQKEAEAKLAELKGE